MSGWVRVVNAKEAKSQRKTQGREAASQPGMAAYQKADVSVLAYFRKEAASVALSARAFENSSFITYLPSVSVPTHSWLLY